MKIELILTYLFLALSHISYSQQKEIILKKCFSESTESFTSKNYICQKMAFEDQYLIYKINYSDNGWQIYDSIVFKKEGEKFCIKKYQPIYDVKNRVLKSYELLYVDCYEEEPL